MKDSMRHLSEEERQTLADATIDGEPATASAQAHLARCTECAADVEEIRSLMKRARETPADPGSLDELWPAIHSRIDARKVIAIADRDRTVMTAPPVNVRPRWAGRVAAIAAAAVIVIIAIRAGRHGGPDAIPSHGGDTTATFVAATDSARSYEIEAQALLNRLELQRATLRPEAAQSLERDLRSIDAAIVDLKSAIVRDPDNATLRQLLASSYRQKIDLLKRASNAS
jgi:hypothetical protein